jgi:DNA-binding MarR family transcriptional regulator
MRRPAGRTGPRISTPEADAIIALSSATQSVFARVAELHPLTPAHARLLCVLAAGGPRGMTELAGLMGVEKAALTGLADRAERRGLLTRSPRPADRRAISLTLTDQGRDAAQAFHRDVSAQLSALTAVLPEEERLMFCRSVARICASQPGDTRGGDTPEGAQ